MEVTYPFDKIWQYGWPGDEHHSPIAVLGQNWDQKSHSDRNSRAADRKAKYARWKSHPGWNDYFATRKFVGFSIQALSKHM